MKRFFFILVAMGTAGFFLFSKSQEDAQVPKAENKEIEKVACPAMTPKAKEAQEKAQLEIQKDPDLARKLWVKKALSYLHEKGIEVQPYHELRGGLFTSPVGPTITFQVFQDGLWIDGLSLTLHYNWAGEVLEFSNQYRTVSKAAVEPAPPLEVERIEERMAVKILSAPARELFLDENSNTPEQAVSFDVRTQKRGEAVYTFRESDGQILRRRYSRSENFRPRF